jgi:orotate phosphoribosyltransferase
MTSNAASDLMGALPARDGHFLLESGYHTDRWLTLDALFVDPAAVAPLIDALADRLRVYAPTAICGSLLGGAFLAQSIATSLGVRFYFTQLVTSPPAGLFTAGYRLPGELAARIRGERVVVVDDVISAGSSARATVREVRTAGAHVVAVGALITLGSAGLEHFAAEGIPLETLDRRAFNVWTPADCPLCGAKRPLADPQTVT